MRVQQVILITSTFAFLSAGCSCAQSPFDFSLGHGSQPTWHQLLEASDKAPKDALIDSLREFRARFGPPESEKREAAYILGRLIQSNPSLGKPKSSSVTAADNATIPGANFAEATALFKEAASVESLHQRALQHAVECATSGGDELSLRQALQLQMGETKDAEKQAGIAYTLAQSFMRTQEYEAAFPLLAKICKQVPDSNYAYGAGYYLADAALNGHPDVMTAPKAIEMFRAYLRKNADGRFARDVMSKLKALAGIDSATDSLVLTPADHESFGQVCYAVSDYKNALAEWAQSSPGAKTPQRALCLARTGQAAEAKATLLEGIRAQPEISYASAADIISTPLTREHTRQFWLQVLAAGPQKADTALWNVALRSEPAEAAAYFKKLIAEYPTSEFAPESVWWLFWSYTKHVPSDSKMIPIALSIAHEGISKYPETRAGERLGYWLGKLHEREKKPQMAIDDYRALIASSPYSYYAHRARARLSALSPHKPDETSSIEAGAAQDDQPSRDFGWSTFPARKDAKSEWSWPAPKQIYSAKEVQEHFGSSVAELLKLHQFDEAVDALPHDSGHEFRSALLAKTNQPLPAINAAKKGLNGPPQNTYHWQLCYPLEYAANVKAEANAKNVDPFLAHALIREESHYNYMALSRSKAIGLMQLLPGTAYGVAKRLGVTVGSPDDFFKPSINIKLGTDYLSYVLGRYNNNALMAVASYNGGPNAVKGWLSKFEDSGIGDYDYFVENIPMRETRDYVRKVFGAYWNYLTIYGAYPMHGKAAESYSAPASALSTRISPAAKKASSVKHSVPPHADKHAMKSHVVKHNSHNR